MFGVMHLTGDTRTGKPHKTRRGGRERMKKRERRAQEAIFKNTLLQV